MSKYIGRLVELGIGRETTRGTGVTPDFAVPRESFSFDDRVTKARSLGALGSIADSEEAFVTTKFGSGDVEGEIRDQSFGLYLYAMLGSLSTSGGDPYTHAFSLSDANNHQSLTFTVKDGNTTEEYDLVMLDSLEITAELDEVIKYAASFMSKTSRPASWTPSYTAENKFTKKHLSFKTAANLAGLSGASAISLKSLVFTVNKNVVLDDALGTAEPEDILNTQLSVEGEITLNYEDETYKDLMRDNTSKAVEIALTNTDQTLSDGSTNPSLTIQMPKVDFFDWEPDYTLDEIVTQTVSFKASKDVSGGNDIISTCDLVNGNSSY